MDIEAAKANLLCMWIVEAMEPDESNLQLMLKYRLAMFKSQRRRNWRLAWIGLPVNHTKDSLAPRFGVTLAKSERLW